ncbi:MAG: 2-oxoacid:acceptor oxidoreductase family protein [Thermodesulfobacteriota bacterium]
MERCRLVFSGSGGQGVITAAIILAEAAVLHDGLNAVQSQSYGAAARGGVTRSDVIISDTEINFPKVNQPNVLVCLTQESYNKFYSIIRPGGLLLLDSDLVEPRMQADARLFSLPLHKSVQKEIGKSVVLNICMLGALLGLNPVVRLESVLEVLKQRVPERFVQMNQKALELGQDLASKAGQPEGRVRDYSG